MKWPRSDRSEMIQGKVPSVYTYSGNSGTPWGYGIGHDAYQIRFSKLDLPEPKLADALMALERTLREAEHLNITDDMIQNHQLPRHLTKSPVDVITDYLTEVAKCVWSDIVEGSDEINLSVWPVDFVITHPAEWDQRAMNLTFQAVTKAFERKFHPSRVKLGSIRLATEPEACAQYTIRSSIGNGRYAMDLNAVSVAAWSWLWVY
jgi:hypothetical protein